MSREGVDDLAVFATVARAHSFARVCALRYRD
jgi:hypothetical protein